MWLSDPPRYSVVCAQHISFSSILSMASMLLPSLSPWLSCHNHPHVFWSCILCKNFLVIVMFGSWMYSWICIDLIWLDCISLISRMKETVPFSPSWAWKSQVSYIFTNTCIGQMNCIILMNMKRYLIALLICFPLITEFELINLLSPLFSQIAHLCPFAVYLLYVQNVLWSLGESTFSGMPPALEWGSSLSSSFPPTTHSESLHIF